MSAQRPALPSLPSPSSPSASDASNAQDAGPDIEAVLHLEEVARARVFFGSFLFMAILVAAFLPFLSGPPWIRLLAGGALVMGGGLCVFALGRLRRPEAYTERLTAALGAGSAIAGVGFIHYVGALSAGAMALTVGLYFFGGSKSRLAARATYAVVVTLYFVSSAGVASGLAPDVGLFPVLGATPMTRWFQVIMSQVIFGVTFYLARRNRRAMEGAIARVNAASMEIRQRDAQLAEARRELDRALRPGEGRRSGEVLGDFRLGDLLGRGGMGEVYRGEHTGTKQQVAVKVLHPNMLDSPDHVKRFLREAEISASVYSRNVVDVLELGQTRDGAPFLVMELLDGHDLGWHLRKRGKLSLRSVIELVDQLSHALIVMRDAGIVHRDLKPGNLFLTDTIPPVWKVLDFGLSKVVGGSTSLTRDQVLGTPSYMAPEQVGGAVDHRTDLYAVAAIAYRALTGSAPFEGDDLATIIYQVLHSVPAAPAELVKLPSDVELILALGLAKKPAERLATIEELAAALRLAATGDLDDGTRARGWQILKRAPWGSGAPPGKVKSPLRAA